MKKSDANKPAFDPSGPAVGSGIFGLPHDAESALVHLIPVPYEATTSYRGGTSKGPKAILEASRQVDLFDLDNGRPYESGIFMLPASARIKRLNRHAKEAARAVIEAGGVIGNSKKLKRALSVVDDASAEVNEIVAVEARAALAAGKIVGLVGGDHSTPFGLMKALTEVHEDFGILHIDAHHDLRDAYEGFTWSHASIMFNVISRLPAVTKLVQVAIRDFSAEEHAMASRSDGRIRVFYHQDMAKERFRGRDFDDTARFIVDALPAKVYVSFDIDGLDPRLCPNTGTPVPGGLDFDEAVHILRLLVESKREIIGFDLNEVAPGRDEWDANVGARMLYKLIGFAIRASRHGDMATGR